MENHGHRNLILLGAGAFLITAVATIIELSVYRSSGDIYLDRSRPGYLPDETEAEEETEGKSGYTYSDTGPFDARELDEYLRELKTVRDHLEKLSNPYTSGPLSDESLGITESPEASEPESSETEP